MGLGRDRAPRPASPPGTCPPSGDLRPARCTSARTPAQRGRSPRSGPPPPKRSTRGGGGRARPVEGAGPPARTKAPVPAAPETGLHRPCRILDRTFERVPRCCDTRPRAGGRPPSTAGGSSCSMRRPRVFSAEGYEGASMRRLASEAELSLAGVYHYVASKEELLYWIQFHTFDSLLQGLRSSLAGRRRSARASRTRPCAITCGTSASTCTSSRCAPASSAPSRARPTGEVHDRRAGLLRGRARPGQGASAAARSPPRLVARHGQPVRHAQLVLPVVRPRAQSG